MTGDGPPLRKSVACLGPDGFHRMSYGVWPGAERRTVICVHGLTRNGRDFDRIARALSGSMQVVCPDVVGRGKSDWLKTKAHYGVPQYASDMAHLLARLDVEEVDWIGTSMGGLIGMVLAAQAGAPIRRLVLNDVGPVIPKAALARIGQYLNVPWEFETFEGGELHLRKAHAPFGPLSDAEWRHLAEVSLVRRDDGKWLPHYDPAIAEAFNAAAASDVDLWPYYDAIACPTLVLRGADSDLLTPDIAEEMTRRGPQARLVEFGGCGHAPALMAEDQIETVAKWLHGAA